MGSWYLPNGLVYRAGTFNRESILVLDGKIAAFGAEADHLRSRYGGNIRDFDAAECLISRGFIDVHVHLREPGFEHKETIATGTAAAAAGGFTTICAMPNTDPPLDRLERLYELKRSIAKTAVVQVFPIACLTWERLGQLPVDYAAFCREGVFLFSDDGDPLPGEIAEQVFGAVQRGGGLLIEHLEEKSLVREGFFQEQIPPESEYLMLQRDLDLVKKTGCRYHAAHLSCGQSVKLIAQAKRDGLPVTSEVTPHHLILTSAQVGKPAGHFQMKPPLRSEDDRRRLLSGLKTGTIDLIATDHAPHGREKEGGLFPDSPFGVTGLETAFPALYTHLVLKKELSLRRLLESLTSAPARILGIPADLEIGKQADLVAVDLKRGLSVEQQNFKSKGTNSPFLGQVLKGWPCLTLFRGKERFLREF